MAMMMEMTVTKFVAFFLLGFVATWALDYFGIIDLGKPETETAPTETIAPRRGVEI